MNTALRHLINAAICVLVLAHAIYLFVSDQLEGATDLRIGLAVAQGVLGLVGALWFWNRSRSYSQ
jgi:hypothetical protein